ARVRAALRRRAGPAAFALGELAIDYPGRRAPPAGPQPDLTATPPHHDTPHPPDRQPAAPHPASWVLPRFRRAGV
ncbi:MAG: hypothetical protein OXF93_23370, partial [Acidobacteria bacterium]|nr:hypothetical protein [Acidobacteriota bacterium]